MKEYLGLITPATIDTDTGDKKATKSKLADFASGEIDATVVAVAVYNPDTLKWEWMQRQAMDINDLADSMGDIEKLLSDSYWQLQKFDYTSGDLDYAGKNTDLSAADGDTDWYIWKYTWVGGNCTLIQGPRVTSWTNRAGGW